MEARHPVEAILPLGIEAVRPVPIAPPEIRPAGRPDVLGRIPRYPAFKPLELTDRFAIESWTRRFPPYSDFNFVSLWTWNTGGKVEVSWLNDNLVVTFKDYSSPSRFYSFLGTNDVLATALTLLEAARQAGVDSRLQLIPEVVVDQAPELRRWARVAIDRSQCDHVLSTDEWSMLAGGHFRKKRNVVHHLERTQAPVFRQVDAGRTDVQRAIQEVFGRWAVQRGCVGEEGTAVQALALKRVFSLERPGDLLSYGVSIGGEMVAYSINEPVPGGYAVGHFWRADRIVPGLYPYLLHQTCRALRAAGCRYLNTMQDLGTPGLAHAKALDRPHHFLRKYVIAPADDPLPIDVPLPGDERFRVLVEAPAPAGLAGSGASPHLAHDLGDGNPPLRT